MIELLEMCGFKHDEAEAESVRVKKAFTKLGITAEDIERAKQRLTEYYDMELQGVREIWGLYLRQMVNLVLAREEGKTKIIYTFMVGAFDIIGSACTSKSKEVYMVFPSELAQLVLGCMFDKLVPVFEAAEGKWLKAGAVSHCGNVKILVGLLTLGLIPKPDLIVTSGWLCETAPKTIDLLSRLYELPTCCYDTCQDRQFKNNYLDETRRVTALSVKSLKKAIERVQEIVGFEITDEMLWEEFARDERRNLRTTVAKLDELNEVSDPLPISATHTAIVASLRKLLPDRALPSPVDAANTLYGELQERVSKGLGVLEAGAPRVFGLQPVSYADPRLEDLIGKMGIALVASEGPFFSPDGTHIPPVKPKDPYEAICVDLNSTLFQSLAERTRTIIETCKKLRVDGVLGRLHVPCRSGTGDGPIIKDAITRELGLPFLLLEHENFDPRIYKHVELERRLGLFKTMLEAG
jgi:benzoyl-CoA reductase/2-hydroxyglutaryl-CoA dehydratase subunit BcrC/BadD/HgdB